jgi:hypothetical protein
MKNSIILLIAIFHFACLYSQTDITSYSYEYDESGNRTKRELIFLEDGKRGGGETVVANSEDTVAKTRIFADAIDNTIINVYPNPTDGLLTLEFSELPEQTKVIAYVYDTQGKLLLQTEIFDKHTDLDFSVFRTGIYILQVYVNEKSKSWNVLKR